MLLGFVGIGEFAGGFQHHLRAHAVPGQRGRIFFLEDLDRLAVDRNAVRAGRDGVRQVAEDGIVLQKMGERFRIGEIVDRHEFNVLVGERGANNVAPDASKTINGNFNWHGASA